MPKLDSRIATALVSLDPSTKHPAWHGAPTVIGLLRGVTPATATWRARAGTNNIREIALHVCFWENSVANRLAGTADRVTFAQRKTGWAKRLDTVDASQWKAEVREVVETHQRIVEIVTHFDPKRLDKPPGENTGRVAIEFIHGVAEHNLYHAAQIKTLKLLAP